MRKRKTRKNQEGAMSLMLAAGVLAFVGVIIYQIPTYFQSSNQLVTANKHKYRMSNAIFKIAQKFRHSYELAKKDPTCPNIGGNSYVKRSISGTLYCFPSSEEMCTEIVDNSQTIRVCASNRLEALRWGRPDGRVAAQADGGMISLNCSEVDGSDQDLSTCLGGGSSDAEDEVLDQARPTLNRIKIPPPTDQMVWRDCQRPLSCIRIAICGQDPGSGEPIKDCPINQALAIQIVRIGPLEVY